MKKLLLFIILFLTYATGFCNPSESIDSLVTEINATCPIKWEYNCTINSVKNNVTVSIRMDYKDEKGDFFTTFQDHAKNNREEWITRLYKISPEWRKLFNQCVTESKTITLLIYSTGGAFSIKIFPEQIEKMKSSVM